MRRWVTSQIRTDDIGPLIVIDPHGIATDAEVQNATGISHASRVEDWFELRKEWERHGRQRDHDAARLVIVVSDSEITASADLPYDIDQASAVLPIRSPSPTGIHAALMVLDDEASDRAVERMDVGLLSPVDAVLTAAADLQASPTQTSGPRQFQAALRLVDHPQPEEVLELARSNFHDPLAQSVLAGSPALNYVQRAWENWVADPVGSPWARHMHECRAELIDLFLSGRLAPAPQAAQNVPKWSAVGVAGESPFDRAAALLESTPNASKSVSDWVRAAQWWGELRSCLAQINPIDSELEAKAWAWWAEADEQFLAWLRMGYGGELTRAWSNWPVSLDKVQPFLAKRRAAAPKLLLIILDGMGFTQWARIRDLSSISVAQTGGVLAMLPTLTEVSRQAIAAGMPPIGFAESLRSTSKEKAHWASAWSTTGATNAWVRIDGAQIDELDAVPFDSADVIGLVLSATDELMHSAELLGDIGLNAGLEAWVQSGVFSTLLSRASEHGYETWLTADHGNLAVKPTKEAREGAFVERAGTRARRYASKTLRDDATMDGISWDALPGYPTAEAEKLLFAPGQTGWGSARLSHGGLSLDEVIVPLVQIEPQS